VRRRENLRIERFRRRESQNCGDGNSTLKRGEKSTKMELLLKYKEMGNVKITKKGGCKKFFSRVREAISSRGYRFPKDGITLGSALGSYDGEKRNDEGAGGSYLRQLGESELRRNF